MFAQLFLKINLISFSFHHDDNIHLILLMINLMFIYVVCCYFQDRDKLQRHHLNDTVEELKRFNARRKLKGAVQAIASGVALDPLCCADSDSGKLLFVCGITIAIYLIHDAFAKGVFYYYFFLWHLSFDTTTQQIKSNPKSDKSLIILLCCP